MNDTTQTGLIKAVKDHLEDISNNSNLYASEELLKQSYDEMRRLNSIVLGVDCQEKGNTVTLLPELRTIWTHRNGISYKVVGFSNTESTNDKYPVMIHYDNAETGSHWSRPAADWDRSMTLRGMAVAKWGLPPVVEKAR